jgi:hypothetical protein
MNAPQLEGYALRLMQLKEQELFIKEERTKLENDIATAIATKDEGTDTVKAGQYKITVTSKLTRTLDYPAYMAIENDIPEGIRCVNLKPELDMKKLRAMEMVRPGFSAQFVTSKPAKAAVKIEEI